MPGKSNIHITKDNELIFNLPVAVYRVDTNGVIDYYNEAAIRLWGREPVPGKDRWIACDKIYTPQGTPIPPGSCPLAIALRENRILNTMMLLECPDGSKKYVIPHPQLHYNEKGNLIGGINTLVDVSGQMEEQQKLAENAKQFMTLANSIPNLAWMARPDGWIYWYNQNWYDYTGTTSEEMEGWGWQSLHHPEYLPLVLDRWQQSIQRGEPFEMVFPIKGADQTFRSFLTRIFPVHDENGNLTHWFGSNTDINEQKKYAEILEATLQEREGQMEALFQFAPDAIVSIDSHGKILSWNPEAEHIFGWAEKEVIGKTLTETIIPDRYAVQHNNGMEHYITTGEEAVLNKLIEVFAVHKTKREFPIELKISTTNLNGQNIFFGFIRDITKRKHSEEIIKNKTNQLIEAQELAHIGSWEWDVRANKIDWSDELYRIFGLAPQQFEATYEAYLERIHTDDRETVHSMVQKAFADHQPFSFHHKAVYPDNNVRIIRSTGRVFTDDAGETMKMSGTAQDVTEQREREMELKESQERFFNIFDNNPVPLSLAEIKTNKITYVNNMFCTTFGYDKEEVIGRSAQELQLIGAEEYQRVVAYIFGHLQEERSLEELQSVSPAESEALLQRLRESEATKHFEVKYKRKNGELFPAVVSFEILKLNSENYAVTSYMDITERKKNEIQLKMQNEELEKINKELESFSYISSHDLQEPLRKIQLFAGHILEREYAHLSDKGKDQFKRMQLAAEKMQTLIQDLLTYSRTSNVPGEQEYGNLIEIVEELKYEYSESIHEKQATFEVSEEADLKFFNFQIRQILHNLIGNSLKFARPDHPPHILITSKIIAGRELPNENLDIEKQYYHLNFKDNGIGFKKEYRHKIFEVFQRLNGKEEYPGSGIGLAIVKKIVVNHEGVISASGEIDKGATFDIFIPLRSHNSM